MEKFMEINKSNPIGVDSELSSLLLGFVELMKADAVILYKYIHEDDLEVSELLSLLIGEFSGLNDDFYNNIIQDNFTTYKTGGLKELIEDYKCGKIDYKNKTHTDALKEVKSKIKVLRFCALAEKNPEKSRWKFDYNLRPPKYFIFDNNSLKAPYNFDIQDEESEPDIPHEGVTSLFCRAPEDKFSILDKNYAVTDQQETIKAWFLKKENIDKRNAHHSKTTSSDSKSNVYRTFSSHHAAWIMLEIEDEKSKERKQVGCLRFEFYDSSINNSSDRKKIKQELKRIAIRPVNDVLVHNILKISERNREHSYERLYKCLIPFLEHIKIIGQDIRGLAEDDIREELLSIHYQIEHLFYVLKRNTYYGEAITTRIKDFIEVFLEKLSLPKDIFSKIWNRLKRHENLMLYDLEKYRDHLIHQFHTMISGYIIIHRLGLDYFQKLIDKNYGNFVELPPDDEKEIFSKVDVIRIWTLTSLFHDCGYVFEKLPDGLKIFSKRVLNLELKSRFFWDELVFEGERIPKILQELSSYYIFPTKHCHCYPVDRECNPQFNESFIFRTLIQNTVKHNDHGVLSAIILMQHYYKNNEGFNKIPQIAHIINISCLAISLHNKPIFTAIKKMNENGICLSLNPMAFLLAYCDISQEWGRIKIYDKDKADYKKNNRYVSPELKKIEIELSKNNSTNCTDNISIHLNYPAKAKGYYLDPEEINHHVHRTLYSFTAPKDKCFEIKYSIRNNRKNGMIKRFNNCANSDKCEAESLRTKQKKIKAIQEPH